MSAASLMDLQQRANDWASSRRSPFGLPIPKEADRVEVFGFVEVDVYGTQYKILEYEVWPGWFFLGTELVLGFSGSGNAPNAGDVKFTVDIDIPLGAAAGQGYTEKFFANVPFLLGEIRNAPNGKAVEFQHRNKEIIRIKGTPIQNMGIGAGNFLTAILSGWTWPERGYEL